MFYGLRPEAVRRLIDALRLRFNSPVSHGTKYYTWDTVIRLKAQELASYIADKRAGLEFGEPKLIMHRTDSQAIRNRIRSMTTAEARKRGLRKDTLWHLKKRAMTSGSFILYGKTLEKICTPND